MCALAIRILDILHPFWSGVYKVSPLAHTTPLRIVLEVWELNSPVASLWLRGRWLFITYHVVTESGLSKTATSVFTPGGVGVSRIFESWDFFEVTDNGLIPTLRNVYLINVCMSTRIWSKTCFYYNWVTRWGLKRPLFTKKCLIRMQNKTLWVNWQHRCPCLGRPRWVVTPQAYSIL